MSTIKCVAGTQFSLDGILVDIKNLQCKKQITGEVIQTNQKCGKANVGSILQIGFESPNAFVGLIKVCYNESSGSTLYTEHDLYGNAVLKGCVTEDVPAFKCDGLTPNTRGLTVAYKKAAQKTNFTKLSKKLGARFKDNVMLVKGHLTPYCDALFPTWKLATMFYVNATPKWFRVNGGNWVRIEALVRGQAKFMRKTLKVFTGTYDVLKLDGVTMKLLPNGFVEVPKYIWKILKDPDTEKESL